jgi:hypothetical protein
MIGFFAGAVAGNLLMALISWRTLNQTLSEGLESKEITA